MAGLAQGTQQQHGQLSHLTSGMFKYSAWYLGMLSANENWCNVGHILTYRIPGSDANPIPSSSSISESEHCGQRSDLSISEYDKFDGSGSKPSSKTKLVLDMGVRELLFLDMYSNAGSLDTSSKNEVKCIILSQAAQKTCHEEGTAYLVQIYQFRWFGMHGHERAEFWGADNLGRAGMDCGAFRIGSLFSRVELLWTIWLFRCKTRTGIFFKPSQLNKFSFAHNMAPGMDFLTNSSTFELISHTGAQAIPELQDFFTLAHDTNMVHNALKLMNIFSNSMIILVTFS
ncbi:hypothetical protein EV368DRAFT_64752 [Lentinula lateritia]|nr:hypothetical protein EV368DRAFT_64752 [Lentinula lateritia]